MSRAYTMGMEPTVCVFTDVSPGLALRLSRLRVGLSQLEVAAFAHVQITDVRRAEHDRRISPAKLERIHALLDRGETTRQLEG